MRFTVLTIFPEIIQAFFTSSIFGKAVERGIIETRVIDIRSFAYDKHKSCDDVPYGGGAGMVLKPEPLFRALDQTVSRKARVVCPTPSGITFNQAYAQALAAETELVLICGRYEGIDQRVVDAYVDDEISIGDYVMSSGELASLVVIDCVYRLISGVIRDESLEEESFSQDLLEYPQYTRPEVFRGHRVPDVLLSGHHAHIEGWRWEQRVEKTKKNRPDLYRKFIESHGDTG